MKKLVILLAAALTFNSCSDSFLDLSNPSALSPSVYPKSMADMETIVTSVYANMVAVPLYGKRVMAKGTFCVDHTVDMAWTGDANWNQLATNQVTSDNAYIGTLWIGYYKMISCANTVLEQLERIDKEKFTDADLVRLSQMKGEALFWRGWAHQQLVAFFGEGYPCNGDGDKKGVPVRLQVASTPDMLNIERSTVAEVYDQILKDYEAAKLLLPAVWEERADYPRPTSVAVASYIGQANLYMGNYDAAKKALKEVIDSSGKELLPFNEYAKMFNVIDSFDTHARIPEHFDSVDAAAKESGHIGIISVGWDPGMFSLNRLYANAILTNGKDYTFWGKGVSQGHSDAVRRIKGVKDAKQYTIPVEAALEAVRNGENPDLTTRQKHTRECFVVAEEGADLAQIENDIKTMPNYFSDYDTTVHFISEEELKRDHSGIPHGGFVIRSGKTGWNDENNHVIEYSLKLDSNPEFTSSVLVAYARAAYRMNKEGQSGAKTVFDVAPAYLCAADGAELRKHLL